MSQIPRDVYILPLQIYRVVDESVKLVKCETLVYQRLFFSFLFVRRQIALADLILLNKIDQATEEDQLELSKKIK